MPLNPFRDNGRAARWRRFALLRKLAAGAKTVHAVAPARVPESRIISQRSQNAFSPRGTKVPVGAVQCVLRPSLLREEISIVSSCASLCLALSQPGRARLPATLIATTQSGEFPQSVSLGRLRLPAREFRDPAMGIAHFPAAAKFCNVHQRHSHFAAPPRPEAPSRELPTGEGQPAHRTAKSGSRVKRDSRARIRVSD
jgi:hypothetical protein